MKNIIAFLKRVYESSVDNEWGNKLARVKIKDTETLEKRLEQLFSRWLSNNNQDIAYNFTREIQPLLLKPLETYHFAILASDLNYFEDLSQEALAKIANEASAFACFLGEYFIAEYIFNQVIESSPKNHKRIEILLHYSLFGPEPDAAMEWVDAVILPKEKQARSHLKLSVELYNDAYELDEEWGLLLPKRQQQDYLLGTNTAKFCYASSEEITTSKKTTTNSNSASSSIVKKWFNNLCLRNEGVSSAPTTPTDRKNSENTSPNFCDRLTKSL